MGPPSRSAKLIQAKRLLRFRLRCKAWGPDRGGAPARQRRVKEIVAQVLEEASVEAVGARGRGDGQLSAARRAFLGGRRQRVDAELLDRVQRNGEPHPGALCLIHDVGGIDAVVGKVAVVEAASGKANRPLVAAAGVDGAGDEGRQRRPVAAIERQFIRLRSLDQAGHRAGVAVHQRRSGRDFHALFAARDLQASHPECASCR